MLRKAALLPLLAALAVSACESSTGPGTARLSVLLTDAPSDYLASASVDIGEVRIRSVEGGWQTVVEDGGTFELLDLQNGVTALLGTETIPAGTYDEIRLVVQSATVTLKDEYQFEDGTKTMSLKVPSGATSGIKIALELADGEAGDGGVDLSGNVALVVDFDVASNFVMLGSPESGIKGFNFTPRLRAVVQYIAGSIAGTVMPLEELTAGLTVTATRVGAPVDEVPAATGINADGTWFIPFVAPGDYEVTVAGLAVGKGANTLSVSVADGQAVTGVELVIEDE